MIVKKNIQKHVHGEYFFLHVHGVCTWKLVHASTPWTVLTIYYHAECVLE